MYFGHHNGWKFPAASELFGGTIEQADDWCSEHLVPESQCIECNPELYPKPIEYGFCDEHGVAECVLCHPDLAQVKGEPPKPQYDTSQAIALLPRIENNSRNTFHKSRIQFASKESIDKYGIDIGIVEERAMSDELTANGEIVFNPTRVAHLTTKVPGTVAVVVKTVGDEVQCGDVVALVDAAQVGFAKSQLLDALVQFRLCRTTEERLRPIGGNAIAGRTFIEAQSALEEAGVKLLSARQALANLGFEIPDNLESVDPKKLVDDICFAEIPSDVLSTLPRSRRTANLIPVLSPLDGIVVKSEMVAGEVVDTNSLMATVADPRQMWLILNVGQEDTRFIRNGLPVRFSPDNGAAEVNGTISWISPAVDQKTRTLQIRILLDNADGNLRDRTFGTGRIILREEPHAIVVPRTAVQSTQDAKFVFVRDKNYFDESAPKVFYVRQVRLGASDEDFIEVLAGVLPGEIIATKGSNVLLGQLLRSNLGAGCGCHQE
ncbi:MAG: efflux RND transporter periplasmic adaptor subunit [Planctomycetaceae bacterium]